MAKMDGLVGFELNQSLPLPDDLPNLGNGIPLGAPGGYPMGARGLSVSQNGMEMLRSLSLSGGLVLQQPDAEAMWERRPSGRVYSEEETSWMMDQRVA